MNGKSNSDSASSNSQAPSVPISIYRELSAELQANRAMLDALNTQNQRLAQENQILRKEIERIVQNALGLQHLLNLEAPVPIEPPAEDPSAVAEAAATAARLRVAEFTPVVEQPTVSLTSSKKPRDLGGLWLTLTLLAIVITAFGAGFLLMRPFLPTGNR